MRRASLLALGLILSWTAGAVAQDKVQAGDWYIFKPPWEQANQMLCTEVRRDRCTLLDKCAPSGGKAQLTFDFGSDRINFGIALQGVPDIRITGRTFSPSSKVNPTMALLVSDGRLFKLEYRLNDPRRGQVIADKDGRLVVMRSKDDVAVVEPVGQLIGHMIGHTSFEAINKEATLEVMRFECVKKAP